jgi:hypothetical protein
MWVIGYAHYEYHSCGTKIGSVEGERVPRGETYAYSASKVRASVILRPLVLINGMVRLQSHI